MKATTRLFRLLATGGLLAVLAVGAAPPAQAASSGGGIATPYPTMCQAIVPSPGWQSELTAVTTSPAGDIWAVGYFRPVVVGEVRQPLVLHFNGKEWVPMTDLPNTGPDSMLTAVAATSSTDVWVLGVTQTGVGASPLVLHYTGSAWQMAPNPLAYIGSGTKARPAALYLTGVTMIAPNTPMVIGYTTVAGVIRPIALVYGGDSWMYWNFNDLPDGTQLTGIAVTGIAAQSATAVWVVGSYPDKNPASLVTTTKAYSVLLHFDGSMWSVAGKVKGNLRAVTASGNDLIVVGHDIGKLGAETMSMHYLIDQGRWAPVDAPNPDVDHNFLTGVASQGTEIFAVGYAGVPTNQKEYTPLVLRFDGTAFQPVYTVHPGMADRLAGVVFRQGEAWAVGSTATETDLRLLVLTTRCGWASPSQ